MREGDLVEIRPQAFGLATRLFSFWDPEKEREQRDIDFAMRAAMAVLQDSESRLSQHTDPHGNSLSP